MSTQDVKYTSFTPELLRSRTPEVSDKVAQYFESMKGTTPDPPPSVHSGSDIAHSERSVPYHHAGNYDNGYYSTSINPQYSMLPPEMRREDSAARLEKEVFGDDHHGSSDYLRSARNGNGNGRGTHAGSRVGDDGGYVGPRSRRDEGSEFNGIGPQRIREETRTGWDDAVRSPRSHRSAKPPPPSQPPPVAYMQPNPHYARSTAAYTAAGFELPGSDDLDPETSESISLPMPHTVDHNRSRVQSRAASVAPQSPQRAGDNGGNPPTTAPRQKHESYQTMQSSEPSFGPGPARESMFAPAPPLSNLPPPTQRVEITIQAPTDPSRSRGVTPIPYQPSERAESVRTTSRAGTRTAKSVREEGEEWARRERERERAMQDRETAVQERERQLEELAEEVLEHTRPISPTRTARTARSVQPHGVPLPLSGRTTPTGTEYQAFRAPSAYGGGGAGGGGSRYAPSNYARSNAPQSPPGGPPAGSTYARSQAPPASNYARSQAPAQSAYAPSQAARSQYAPSQPPQSPPQRSRYAPSQAPQSPSQRSRYAPSQQPQSPTQRSAYAPSARDAPRSPQRSRAGTTASAAPPVNIHVPGADIVTGPSGGDVDIEMNKNGETVIHMHNHSRAPSRAQSQAPPVSERGREPSIAPPHSYRERSRSREPAMTERSREQMPIPERTPRTSYTLNPSELAEQVSSSHFHDEELCTLLRTADDTNMPDVVRRAVRRAVVKRMRKLGMEGGPEEMLRSQKSSSPKSMRYRERMREAEPSPQPTVMAVPTQGPVPVVVNVNHDEGTVPPPWAQPLFEMLERAQSRLDELDTKLESTRQSDQSIPDEEQEDLPLEERIQELPDDDEDDGLDPINEETASQAETEKPLPPPHSPAAPDISFRVGNTEITIHQNQPEPPTRESTPPNQDRDDNMAEMRAALKTVLEPETTDGGREPLEHEPEEEMEEELYKLRQKPVDRSDAVSHRTWEIEREEGETIPDLPPSERGHRGPYARKESPPLPPLPDEALDYDQNTHAQQPTSGPWPAGWAQEPPPGPVPWQRVHQRLLNWAIVWPTSELDNALLSCSRGHQVDEIALSIWTTQVYKRYVRARMTDNPPGRVDRLFVPPNMADAINNAVFNGRHGDACGMLRDLWAPFGLEGMPRLLVVLARHRRDENHWVVHRFSLPDGNLTTYDTYPERSLPDGRPLGWWFAIRIAWPHAMYPHPDHLVQKMVRLHRPLQLLVDNSVAAAAIWRNILMGSKPERQVDLERLRDLISSEVRNLRTRKDMGRLSISTGKTGWDDVN